MTEESVRTLPVNSGADRRRDDETIFKLYQASAPADGAWGNTRGREIA